MNYSHFERNYSHFELDYFHFELNYSHFELNYSHFELNYSHFELNYSHFEPNYYHFELEKVYKVELSKLIDSKSIFELLLDQAILGAPLLYRTKQSFQSTYFVDKQNKQFQSFSADLKGHYFLKSELDLHWVPYCYAL